MTYKTVTLCNAMQSWMFVWTDESKNIGIIHIGCGGRITGQKMLPREHAKSLFMHLRLNRNTKVAGDACVDYLPDYKATIAWLLERI